MNIAHSFPFDPTYGHTLESLLQVGAPAGPADFETFWRSTHAEAMSIPTHATRQRIDSENNDVEAYEITFDSWGGVRIAGWMTVPRNRAITRGVVVGHGYNGRAAPDWELPGEPAVAIFPCARGLGQSRLPGVSAVPQRHVLSGIRSRQTYIHRGCCCDTWAAATVLLEWFPEVRGRLDYMGGSFGGGIGAMMLPWDDRFRRAYLNVPSFGNHPLRVTLECIGSGHAVRNHYLRHPDVLDVLSYFDAATAAQYLHIPTFVAAALFDPAVAPPGQFAVYNALPGHKELFVRQTGHFETPESPAENQRLFSRLDQWFGPSAGE